MPLHSFPGTFGASRNSVQRSNTGVGGATHTAPATAHTLGTPTQLIASTPFDTVGLSWRMGSNTTSTGVRTDCLAELMVGGSGSEQTIIGPWAVGFTALGRTLAVPIFIPAGSRISVRHKSHVVSKAIAWSVDLFGGPTRDTSGLPTRWVSYGLVNDASNSRGTQVTAGNSNAWGSWTALTTSTTYAHSLWIPNIDGGSASTTTALNYRSQWAIASTTDAATMATNGTHWDGPRWATTTAEVMTDQQSPSAGFVQGDSSFTQNGIIHQSAPAGSSVSMRAMCSGTAEASCFGSILAAVM